MNSVGRISGASLVIYGTSEHMNLVVWISGASLSYLSYLGTQEFGRPDIRCIPSSLWYLGTHEFGRPDIRCIPSYLFKLPRNT
jgi:hypothetical protein